MYSPLRFFQFSPPREVLIRLCESSNYEHTQDLAIRDMEAVDERLDASLFNHPGDLSRLAGGGSSDAGRRVRPRGNLRVCAQSVADRPAVLLFYKVELKSEWRAA
jgi:hypothetical protein